MYPMSEFRESTNTCGQYNGVKCHSVVFLTSKVKLYSLAVEIAIPRYTQISDLGVPVPF